MASGDLLNCAVANEFIARSIWLAVTVTGGASIEAISGDKSVHTPRWTLMLDPTDSLSGITRSRVG
ncbi:hypothetical protein Ait01nite_022800 [Actinoplanes italicus]|nr:hypothetical protein Ait01nite_022800 [Actinoplanes italicus]